MKSITESEESIGDYEVLDIIGQGYSAEVFKAKHIPTNQ
jgi:hypothetical protein